MTGISKYDVVIVRFPFASSLKYKARPAVVLSSDLYLREGRETLIIVAVSSRVDGKLSYEPEIFDWESSGLLKPSIFKAAVATIEKSSVLTRVGTLSLRDRENLRKMNDTIC